MARDLVAERRAALARLTAPMPGGTSLDRRIRLNLQDWYSRGPQPSTIVVRGGFAWRTLPLTDEELEGHRIEDRPKPDLPRVPPLATLTTLSRGVGLRLALTLLFLAQTGPKNFVGKAGQLNIGIDHTDARPHGLVDLVAVPAAHTPTTETGVGTSANTNRKRQIRTALNQLAGHGIGMIQLPSPAASASRFRVMRLREEIGSHTTTPAAYQAPTDGVIFEIPVEFFLNGWIHALRNIEIAMWLMLRSEQSRSRADVRIDAHRRLVEYDLSIAAYETNTMLRRFQLVDAEGDPMRRANGTTIGGRRSLAPHSFSLMDEQLDNDGVATVVAAL